MNKICIAVIFFLLPYVTLSQKKPQKIRVGVWEFYDVNLLSKENIWVNDKEKPGNGIDDDKNGFIDDVYGIGFNYLEQPIHHNFTPTYKGKDSANDVNLYFHGSAVAQVIVRNNPNVELVGVGFLRYVERKYDSVWAKNLRERLAGDPKKDMALIDNLFQISAKYFKEQKVKVVNISWMAYKGVFKSILEDLGIYDKAIESRLDNEWLMLFYNSLYKVFKENPDIVFVIAAGNEAKDIDEIFAVPAVIDLPNVITVGGLSPDGKKIISFSNYGKNVKVYATAYYSNLLIAPKVEWMLTGTSFAAPVITAYVAQELQKGKKIDEIKKELEKKRFVVSK